MDDNVTSGLESRHDHAARTDTYRLAITAEHPDRVQVNHQGVTVSYILSRPVETPVIDTLLGEPTGETRVAFDQTEVTLDEYLAAEAAAGVAHHPDADPAIPAAPSFVDPDTGILGRVVGSPHSEHSAVLPPGLDFCNLCGHTHTFVETTLDLFKREPIGLTPVGLGRYCQPCATVLASQTKVTA